MVVFSRKTVSALCLSRASVKSVWPMLTASALHYQLPLLGTVPKCGSAAAWQAPRSATQSPCACETPAVWICGVKTTVSDVVAVKTVQCDDLYEVPLRTKCPERRCKVPPRRNLQKRLLGLSYVYIFHSFFCFGGHFCQWFGGICVTGNFFTFL